MSRFPYALFFAVIAISLALYFSLEARRYLSTGQRSLRAATTRFITLLGFLALFLLVGISVDLAGRYIATRPTNDGVEPQRPQYRKRVRQDLPVLLVTVLISSLVSFLFYRRQERLAELLKTTTEKLSRSERNRTDLLRDLAHDVRSPLTSLRLVLDILQMNKEDWTRESLLERTSTAIRELDYLQRLIDSLLLLAQLEDPEFGRAEETVDLAELVEELKGHCEDHPDRLHLTWSLENSVQGPARVRGNRVLLDRALRNAFENAGQYAQTRVVIRLSARENKLELRILDDGKGFTDETRRAFGKRRGLKVVDPSLSSLQSMGLGSTVLCSTIERLGGTIEVRNGNELGGAEIQILLPLASTRPTAVAA